jgi:hypothetical protein
MAFSGNAVPAKLWIQLGEACRGCISKLSLEVNPFIFLKDREALRPEYCWRKLSSSLMPLTKWLHLFLVCTMLGLSPVLGEAQSAEWNYKGMSESDINVGIFSSMRVNCTAAPLPVLRLITPPTHGRVIVKQTHLLATNFQQCLGTELPAFVAFYRSTPNYIGEDEFTLEVTGSSGNAQLQRITITIVKPDSAQGI